MSIPSDEDEPSPRADADADSYTDMCQRFFKHGKLQNLLKM